MLSHRARSIINIVCFVLVLSINYLATALPINGVTQKELSAEYQLLLTPAGYVFSIWGVIYLGLTAYITVQALPKWLDNKALRQLDLPFVLSSLCNAVWLVVWHYRSLTISVLLMLGLLGSLIWAYIRLEQSRATAASASFWFVDKTFRIYLGWVGIATILNIAIWLQALGWNGAPLTAPVWAVIMLGVACILYLYLSFSRNDAAVVGVLSWASLGIAIKNQDEKMVWIASLVVCCICLMTLVKIVLFSPRKMKLKHN